MDVENAADFLARRRSDFVAQLGEIDDGLANGITQTLDLPSDLRSVNMTLGDDQVFRVQHNGRGNHHAGRDTDAFLDLHLQIRMKEEGGTMK